MPSANIRHRWPLLRTSGRSRIRSGEVDRPCSASFCFQGMISRLPTFVLRQSRSSQWRRSGSIRKRWPPAVPWRDGLETAGDFEHHSIIAELCDDLHPDGSAIRMLRHGNAEPGVADGIDPTAEHALRRGAPRPAADFDRVLRLNGPSWRWRCWHDQGVELTPPGGHIGPKDGKLIHCLDNDICTSSVGVTAREASKFDRVLRPCRQRLAEMSVLSSLTEISTCWGFTASMPQGSA